MSGYLGFDRARVQALLVALDDLEGERARLGRDVGDADGPLVAYRFAVQRLLEWQPRLHAVLGYADGPGYDDVDISWRLPDAIVLTGGGRWRDVVEDPRRVPPRHGSVSPGVRAEALTALLADIDLDALVLDEELLAAVHAELLAVAASPAAAAQLLARLGLSRFHAVATALGERWADRTQAAAWSRPGPDGEQLRSVLEGFGAVVGAASSLDGRAAPALLAGLPVTALAPVLAGAARQAPGALPTDELIRAALLVLDAAAAARTDREGAALTDPVLAALVTDHMAAQRVLERLPDATFEVLIVRPRHDPELLSAMLLASNDPARTSARAVEASMSRVLAVLAEHRDWLGHAPLGKPYADVPPHLGIYLGRWAEAIIAGWGLDRATTMDHVGWLVARPDVAVELLVTLQLRYAQRVVHIAGGHGDFTDVAYAHAALADLVAHAELGAALAGEASWARLVAGAQFALDAAAVALTPVLPPVGAGLGAASLASSGAEVAGVSPSTWLLELVADRPQPASHVLARQAADRDAADAAMEHATVAATVSAFLSRHPGVHLPSPPPAPRLPAAPAAPGPDDAANEVGRDYHGQLRDWVDDLAATGDPQLRELAEDVNQAALDVRGAALDARNHVAA